MAFTKRHQAHLDLIHSIIANRITFKYKKGAKEHGGHLADRSALYLVDNMIDEALDQLVYAITLKEKLIQGGNTHK